MEFSFLSLKKKTYRDSYLFPFIAVGTFALVSFFARLVFFLYNFSFWDGSVRILYSFLLGTRLDVATILIIESPLFLYWLLPVPGVYAARWPRFSILLHSIITVILIFVNLIDVAYYPFSEKRITYELFTLQGDVRSFSPAVLLGYGWLFFLLGFLGWFNYRLTKHLVTRWIQLPVSPRWPSISDALLLPVVFVFIFLGIRGVGEKPLRPEAAFFGPERFSGHVASNTGYNMLYSTRARAPDPLTLMNADTARRKVRSLVKNSFDGEFIEDYTFHRNSHFDEKPIRKNIILIVMESFNGEDTGILYGKEESESLTPGFDRLAKKGLLFTNYYANARRSIEAFPAILASIPDLLSFPVIGSFIETNHSHGIGNILKENGYRTMFFHGGRNGTMGLENYSKIAGFEQYLGMSEYESERNSDDYDGHWGIYDDKFFDYFYNKMKDVKDPYFAVFFSLSNHHPYTLPPGDQGGADKIRAMNRSPAQKTLLYADASLAGFMDRVSRDPAFQNTIFLITADHNSFEGLNFKRHIPDLFRVPFLIYSPGFIEPGVEDQAGSHVDVLPTVLELLRINASHGSMGRSLLEKGKSRTILLQESGMYAWMKDEYVYVSSFQGLEKYYVRKKGKWGFAQSVKKAKRKEMQTEFRAFFQEAHNALVTNTLLAPGSQIKKVSEQNFTE